MIIRLAEYKEGVETPVRQDYKPKDLDIEFVDFVYSDDLHMEGTVEKGLDTLTFRGHLHSNVKNICGRCLKHVDKKLDCPFTLYYEIKGKEIIDTIDDLREAVLLEHPISYICAENCKGLCPECGANLNEAQCQCKREEPKPSSPFAQLKKLWSPKREE